MKPKQSIPKDLRYTVADFNAEFANKDACLEYVKEQRWPNGVTKCEKCGVQRKHHRVTGRTAYACQVCGHHITFTRSLAQYSRSLQPHSRLGFMRCILWVPLVAASPQSRSSVKLASPTKRRGACSARFGVSWPKFCNWRARRWRWTRCTTAGRDSG